MNVFIDLTGKQKKNPKPPKQKHNQNKTKPKTPTDFVSTSKCQKGNN